jgi:carbon-monoxide dehydrogenase small subunit
MPEFKADATDRAVSVELTVNGQARKTIVEARTLLVDCIRETLGLTGTHVGCDTAQCGCCTVLVDGDAVKSCTMLAVQAEGANILTIEGLEKDGVLHPLQQAFHEHHALQCGYCTPGFVMSALELITKYRGLDESNVRPLLDGNMCRCTGYHNIVKAILSVANGRPETGHSHVSV